MNTRIDIPAGDPRVQRGIIELLAGKDLPDIGPPDGSDVPCLCPASEELAAIKQAIAEFTTAEQDLLRAQSEAARALRDPANDHCRCSDEAVDAYERKLKAADRIAALLGVVVLGSARRR